jgi:hypothetical protein
MCGKSLHLHALFRGFTAKKLYFLKGHLAVQRKPVDSDIRVEPESRTIEAGRKTTENHLKSFSHAPYKRYQRWFRDDKTRHAGRGGPPDIFFHGPPGGLSITRVDTQKDRYAGAPRDTQRFRQLAKTVQVGVGMPLNVRGIFLPLGRQNAAVKLISPGLYQLTGIQRPAQGDRQFHAGSHKPPSIECALLITLSTVKCAS